MFLDKVGSFAVASRAPSFSTTEKCSSAKSSQKSTSSSKATIMKNTNSKLKSSESIWITNLLNKNTASSFFCVLIVLSGYSRNSRSNRIMALPSHNSTETANGAALSGQSKRRKVGRARAKPVPHLYRDFYVASALFAPA